MYSDDDASSHFRPLIDAPWIHALPLRFDASSLAAFAIDAATLLALSGIRRPPAHAARVPRTSVER